MTVEEIRAAIEQLSEPERRKLANWFEELEEVSWDDEMARDFSPGGRGQPLVEKINQDLDEAKFTPLEEGLRSRREPH
jgi:hypothetical protein